MSQTPLRRAAELPPATMSHLRACIMALLAARKAVRQADWTTAYPAAWARFTALLDATSDPVIHALLDTDRQRTEALLLGRARKTSLEEITTADLEVMGQERVWGHTSLMGWTGLDGDAPPLDALVAIDALLRDPEMLRLVRQVTFTHLRANETERLMLRQAMRLAGVMHQMQARNPAQYALLAPVFRAGAAALAAQTATHASKRPTLGAMREALRTVPLPTDDGRTLWDFLRDIAQLPSAEFGHILITEAGLPPRPRVSPIHDASPSPLLQAILSGTSVKAFERQLRATTATRTTPRRAPPPAASDAEAPTVVRRGGARR